MRRLYLITNTANTNRLQQTRDSRKNVIVNAESLAKQLAGNKAVR